MAKSINYNPHRPASMLLKPLPRGKDVNKVPKDDNPYNSSDEDNDWSGTESERPHPEILKSKKVIKNLMASTNQILEKEETAKEDI